MSYHRVGSFMSAGDEHDSAVMSGGAAAAMLLGLGAALLAHAAGNLFLRSLVWLLSLKYRSSTN